jgi:hypothetical protein
MIEGLSILHSSMSFIVITSRCPPLHCPAYSADLLISAKKRARNNPLSTSIELRTRGSILVVVHADKSSLIQSCQSTGWYKSVQIHPHILRTYAGRLFSCKYHREFSSEKQRFASISLIFCCV